ncbi:hypothetical protein BKN38_02190 [Helicobacter sp. CLO-3]|uniref:zinc ribbon domain-containing protein n=1 Tax=unclassified Helicobacter TaxID=2593540 RepID=UPI000805265F|nr:MULTISPECIES: C4-type zinc ribbon domain-containing protein [unclassified Helicobacter]OBV29679.1 hypothetical protein BA723_04390 [Helicobacter sp. CLO-3]OHU84870.1 hypothetical protein BKN38_02190 [Helicobacter sp. CLO-3]
MNKNLQQLIEIAQIDKESDALIPAIQEKRATLDKLIEQKDTLDRTKTLIDEERQEANLAIARNETSIQENNQKIENITKRIKDGCSDREARTLSIEEDLCKEQIKHANQEIERLNKEIDAKNAREKDIDKQIKELESSIKGEQSQASTAIDEIKKKQQAIFAKKDKCIDSMDQKIISFYEKIRKWAKNTSVVPVSRNACGGCFIRLNDNVLSALEDKNNTDITTCPHCGRIIYIAND